MDFSTLFLIEDPENDQAIFLNTRKGTKLTRKQGTELFYGEWKPVDPIVFEIESGVQTTDFIWTEFPWLKCVSERVIDLLRTNNISGWSTFPIELRAKNGQIVPGYHGFTVLPFVGPMDLSRSQVVISPLPSGKPRKMYKGLFFDENKWDGSDFIRIQAAFTAVTERVKRLFLKNGVSNIMLTSLSEVELSYAAFGPLNKG